MSDQSPARVPGAHESPLSGSRDPARQGPRAAERTRRWPIRRQLVTMIAGVATGALAIAFAAVVAQDIASYRRDAIEQARTLARLVGSSTTADLARGDREAATSRLRLLAGVPALEAAFLYDASGLLFAAWGRPPGPADVRLAAAEEGLAGDRLRVVQPVVQLGTLRGTLTVETSVAPLRHRVAVRIATLAALLVGLVAIAWFAAMRLQRLIADPIVEIARATRRIRVTGDYSLRVRREREDEIGLLCERFNDLLEQIQVHDAQRDAAEQRTQEKSRFLANMSHELRTPLNSIIGFSEVLLGRLESRLDAREAKFLRNIHASGRHLLDVINDILDLAKVEAGRMEIRPEPVVVGPLLDGMATLMRGVAEPRRVAIDVEPEPSLPPLHADPVRAKQILYNLLSNAVKFSPEGGTVRVTARAVDGHWPAGGIEIAVVDHGVGIAPRDQERLFEAFWQADGWPGGRQLGGTGLGLALVKTFVDLHGGTIAVESALGRGSIFRVVLPAAPRPFVAVPDQPPPAAAGTGQAGDATAP